MKRKMVVVNDFPLYPPKFGGQFRLYYLYKNLSRWFDITYLCFGDDKIVETELSENFREIRIPKGRIHKYMNLMLGKILGKGVDDIVAMFFCVNNRKMGRTVENYISNSEIVVASHPYMYPVIEKYAGNKFLIYEALNVEYVLKKAILGDGLFNKFLYDSVKKVEQQVVNDSDIIFTVSDTDRDEMEKIYPIKSSKMFLSPNGVDLPTFSILYKNNKLDKEKIIRYPVAIFMGSGHPPNTEAAKNIINEIAPKMKDVYFLICGSVCWNIQSNKIGNNVGLTFDISDDEKIELYRISDVGLNPMISGSGTNIKMLDYMAAGLPIITTPTGARGLEAKNYDHAIICEVSEFPEKIQELLDNKELYEKLSFNGRKLVEEKYDWKKIGESMAKTLQKKLDI